MIKNKLDLDNGRLVNLANQKSKELGIKLG